MASLLDRLKKNIAGAAKGAVNTASRAYDQVNILDNGRSFQTRTPTTNQSVVQQVNRQVVQPVAQPFQNISKGIVQAVGGNRGTEQQLQRSIQLDNQATDQFTRDLRAGKIDQGRYNALLNDIGKGGVNVGQVNQQLMSESNPRKFVASVADLGFQAATAGVGAQAGKLAFKEGARIVVPQIAKRVAQGASLNATGGAVSAFESDQAPRVQDVIKSAAVGGLVGGAIPLGGAAVGAGAKAAVPLAKKGAQTAVKANEKAFTPRVSVQDQNVLRDFSDLQAGTYSPTPDARGSLIAQARQVGAKYGVDLNSGNPRDLLDKTNSVLDQVGQRNKAMAQGGYINIPNDSSDELVKKVFTKGTDENSLYHGTESEKAIKILQSGKIKANQPNSKQLLSDELLAATGKKYKPSSAPSTVSFSRQRNSGFYNGNNVGVKFVADNNKLGKTEAYVDGELSPSDYRYPNAFEAEQRTHKDVDLKNIKRIELNPSQMTPEEELIIRKMAQEKGIPVVSIDNPSEMRSVLKTKPTKDEVENLESIVQNSNTRPAAEIQTAIERAHNAGDNEAVAQLITQLPEDMQASMRGVFNLPEPKATQRGFVQSVKENADISRETKKATNGTYNVRNTNQLAQSADNYATGDIETITKDVQNRLNVKTGNITDKDVADSITTAEKLDIAGDSERASQIYESLAEHLTKQGQSIQAASLLSRRTPEGLKYAGEKAIKKAGGKISPDLRKQMDAALAEVRNAPIGSEARTYATQKYQTLVGRTLPTSATDKATAIWKAGLLTGIRTQTGGTLSNATFGALRTASDPLASAIDRAISVVTGTRTKTATLRGNAQGFKEGVSKGKAVLKTGIDERADIGNKFDQREVNFGEGALGKAANTYVNGVFRLMGAQDRPWYYRQLRQSLNDLALADGKNKGLRGSDLNKYVDNFTKEPPKGALQVASNEAEKSVLGNETFLSNVAGGIRRAAGNLENPLARNTASAAVNVLMPFTKVPSAFISRVIDYTPVGALKEVGQQIAAKQFDQRALATALSEATTGSAIIYLGAELANGGLLSGTYPTDPKEAARWKAEGIQPSSIKVGDTWLSLNYFGPLGSLFNQGKRVTDSLSEGQGVGGAATNAVGGIATDALSQSFLQGVSGAVDAVQDPKRYAQNFVRNQAGSLIPTLLGDVATATDKSQRQVNSPTDAIKNRLPGLRQTLMSAQDVYGNKLDAKTNPLTGAVNPFRPSDINKSPVLSEVARLHNTDPTNTEMNVTPTAITKKVDINGVQTQLNDKQRYDLQERVGKATQTAWDSLIKTPEYQSLTDPEKADALRNLRTDAAAVAKQQFAAKNNLGQYAADFTGKDKLLTKTQQKLNTGTPDVSTYAKTTSGSTASRSKLGDDVPDNTPDYAKQWINKYKDLDSKQLDDIKYKEPAAEFEYEAAKFEKDLASGKVKKADEIKTRSKLQKLEAGKDTPREIRDLYSLNKTQVYQLITNDPDGNTIAQMLLDYGDKLEGATGTKNKFKTKYGDVDFDPATASTSGTKKKSSGGKKGGGSSKTFQVPGNANPFGSILSATNTAANAASKVSIKAKKPTKRRRVS